MWSARKTNKWRRWRTNHKTMAIIAGAVIQWLKVRFGWLFLQQFFSLLATLFDFVFLFALLHITLCHSLPANWRCEWSNDIVNYRRCFTIKINRVWTILEASISGQQHFIVSYFCCCGCCCCCHGLNFWATLFCCNANERSKLWQVTTMNRIYCH